MSNRPYSTYPDSVYSSRCGLQHPFSSQSMYDSSLTHERDSKMEKFEDRLSGVTEVHPGPPPDRRIAMSCRNLKPESRTQTPLRSGVEALPSPQMSESYIGNRRLSPSFLDLSPSPEYQPPEYSSPVEYKSPSEYPGPSSFEYETSSGYHSPQPCVPTLSCIKRIKRKPPPLILSHSFQSPRSYQSPPSVVPSNDANPGPLTPLTPFTPISPQYRMPSEKEQFRRRLLKLQRTLGEQITPGLVTRPKPNSKITAGLSQRTATTFNPTSNYFPTKRSAMHAPTDQDLLDLGPRYSKNRPLPPLHNPKSTDVIPSSPSFHSLKHRLPETGTLTPITITAFVGSFSATPRNVSPTDRSCDFVLNCDVQDSSSEDDESCPSFLSFDDENASCTPSALRYGPTSHSDGWVQNWSLVQSPSRKGLPKNMPKNMPDTPGVKRKEPRYGWSGEWNQTDIREVIEKLRYL